MNGNMGLVDRTIRVLLSLTVIWMFFTEAISGALGLTLMVFSAIFLLTSMAGVCPLYKIFGFRTCKSN